MSNFILNMKKNKNNLAPGDSLSPVLQCSSTSLLLLAQNAKLVELQ